MSAQRGIGIFEAKTHLSELVAEVEAGASLTLTRRGVAVAQLVPVPRHPERVAALRRLHTLGAQLRAEQTPLTLDELDIWRAEGHR